MPSSPKLSLSLNFQSKTLCMPLLSPICATCPAQPISLFSILSPKQYWVTSTDREAPHYVVFSTLLVPRHSYAQIPSSAPYSQTPSAYVPPSMSVTKFYTHTTGKIAVLYNLIFKFLDRKLEDRRFCT